MSLKEVGNEIRQSLDQLFILEALQERIASGAGVWVSSDARGYDSGVFLKGLNLQPYIDTLKLHIGELSKKITQTVEVHP